MKSFGKPILCLLFLLGWILPGLIGHDPWKPDEAYSLGLVDHIIETGDRLVPTLAGEPFMEKPPLYYVTAAATAKLLSPWLPLHDGARLASALYLAIAFLFAGLAGQELWGKGRGWMTAVVLMGCPGLIIHAHKLITDVALLAGFAVALYGFSLYKRRPAIAGIFLGIGVGIGFLSKGLLAPGIAGVTGILLLLLPEWRTRRFALTLGAAVLASLPWLLVWPTALYHRSPQLFREWLFVHNFGRFLGRVHLGPPKTAGFYPLTLLHFAVPALPLAVASLGRSIRERGRIEPAAQLPLAVFLASFAVLCAAADAREIYALPMLLPLALLATPAAFTLPERAAGMMTRFGATAFGLAAFALGMGWVAMVSGRPAILWDLFHRMHPAYVSSFRGWPAAVAAGYVVLWVLAVVRLRGIPARPVVVWAAGAAMAWGVAMTLWLPWLDAGMTYRPMIESMRRALPGDAVNIASAGLGEPQRALLDYFGNIHTNRLETGAGAGENDFLLVQGSPRATPDPGPAWREIWEGRRVGDDKELFCLFERARPAGRNAALLPPGAPAPGRRGEPPHS